MSEKTGLEILLDLVNKVELLDKKVSVLDQNIKILLNKTDGQKPIKNSPPRVEEVVPKNQPPKEKKLMKIEMTKAESKIMVSGRVVIMVDGKPTPIPDVVIKIYDDRDKLVKETKANRGGVWMSLLSPGPHIAEITGKYKNNELVPQNKSFVVPSGVSEFEVI